MVKLVNGLGTEKALPITLSFPDIPLNINTPTQQLYGRPGSVRTGVSTVQSRQIAIDGSLYDADPAQIRQKADELLTFLAVPPIEVYRRSTEDRCLIARLSGVTQRWMDDDAELQLRIALSVLDPFWHGPQTTAEVTGTQTIEVGGSAPAFPVIKTAGAETAVTISNTTTGQSIVVTGLSSAGVIEVDCANYTCTVGGAGRLDLIDESWFASGFELRPGDNEITTTAAIELVYRPRWY